MRKDGMAGAAGDRPPDRIADSEAGSSAGQQRSGSPRVAARRHRRIAAANRTPETPTLVLPVRRTSNIPDSTARRRRDDAFVAAGTVDSEARQGGDRGHQSKAAAAKLRRRIPDSEERHNRSRSAEIGRNCPS